MEWLTRDPLNGLVITIAFFISLILGRYLREKNSTKYRRRKIDPRIKILLSFLLIVAITLMKHWYLPIVISVSCIAIAARLKILNAYSKKIIFPLGLALFIFALQSFTYGINKIDLGIISIYLEGLKYGFLIFARVLASASILILLVLTTSEHELLESMRWYRVPRTMIEISSFMSRYVKSFSQEAKKLTLAQKSRCGFSGKLSYTKRMHSIASVCGALITRAIARSDEVYRAMTSRAWNPEIKYSVAHPLNKSEMILGILLFSGTIGLLVFDRFL